MKEQELTTHKCPNAIKNTPIFMDINKSWKEHH